MENVPWSDLPEELVDSVANQISSDMDHVRIRSICKPWRSAVRTKKRFSNRFKPCLPYVTHSKKDAHLLYPTTFYRVTLPCTNKGWLIKTRQVSESSKINLLFPLSRQPLRPFPYTLNLLEFGVLEILQSNEIHRVYNSCNYITIDFGSLEIDPRYMAQYLTALEKSKEYIKIYHETSRVVVLEDMVFKVDHKNQLLCCKIGEESSGNAWTRIKDKETENFSDIIVHKGRVYALDMNGASWWISLSELDIYQHTSSTPIMDYYEDLYYSKDERLVEYCGDLCIIHRFYTTIANVKKTVKFKLYKIDKESMSWVEVSSLGDKTLIVAMSTCFTVLASEYYGCLKNAIYFSENDGERMMKEDVNVFKLDDGSISNMADSSSRDCFKMFSPPFL